MPGPTPSSLRNRLLRTLSADDYALLRPRLDAVEVRKGDVVLRADEPFAYAYFPESGLASVLSSEAQGRRLEVGLFGREGMVSTALVLGADRTPHETVSQVGGAWLRMAADALREAMRRSPPLHELLMRYVQTFLLTVGQTALSNGAYKAEERLARWLLLAHDRLDATTCPLRTSSCRSCSACTDPASPSPSTPSKEPA